MKYLMMIFATMFLVACGDKVSTDTTLTELSDIAAGKTLYETAELGCVACHGVDGQSNNVIDLDADSYSKDGQEYALADYIELFMPTSDVSSCDADCAKDIAAYLVSLEIVEEVVASSQLYSVVTRLTNDEYYTALSDLVELSDERQASLRETVELSAELEFGGLVSAAERQQLTQITFSSFLAAATEAANLRLLGGGVKNLSLGRFNAFILCSDSSMSYHDCIRDRGVSYIDSGFRGQATDSDIEALDTLLETFDNLTLEADELERLVLRYQAVVQFVALSPKFVTLHETGIADEEVDSEIPLTEIEIANRLSFFIAGTPPDTELETAAAAGLLSGSEERRAQALRLVEDEESSAGVERIVTSWLGVDADLTDADSIAETEAFVKDWIEEGRPFSDIYTSTVAVTHTAVDEQEASVTQEPFGALGLKAVVESNTNPPVPSFINRGEFVVAELLCGILPEDLPDAAVEGDAEDALEVFEIHSQEDCATCHKLFDNYGAAFQHFDGLTSLYNPGDAWLGSDFELYPVGDVSGTVSNVAELGQILGASRQAHTCFASLWYRHAMRRDLLTADTNEDAVVIDSIVDEWMQGDSSVKSLLELISGSEAFSKIYR